MRAAIYCRISDDKEGAGLGVARQERDSRDVVCEPRGWSVVDVYSDNDRSAYSGKPRPAYERLLQDARDKRIDAIVVWHPDRLHRSPAELEQFIDVVEAAGIQVQTVRAGLVDLSTPTGRLNARLVGAVARYESEHKSDRQRAKHAEIAKAGGVAGGGWRAFGFEPDGITLREDEAEIIREIAKRFLAGETLRSLCVDLDARGVLTSTGKSWAPFPLRRMIGSARISGQREYKGEIIADAVWPAIITPEQTSRIRAKLDDPARQATRARRSYVLAGLVRCSHCDAKLVARPRVDGVRRYVCAKGPGFSGCGKTSILAEQLETLVVEAVMVRLDSADLAAALADGRGPGTPELAEADNLRARLDELATAYAQSAITMREWLTAREPLQKQLDVAQQALSRQSATGVLTEHLGRAGQLRKSWDSLSIDRRAAILGAVVARVTIGPARRGYNRFDPSRVQMAWRY